MVSPVEGYVSTGFLQEKVMVNDGIVVVGQLHIKLYTTSAPLDCCEKGLEGVLSDLKIGA